jgi:phosphopantetheinyl transferase
VEVRGPAGSGPDEAWLTLAERARLAGLRVAKRRDDWLAGRWAAKSVVAVALAAAAPGEWPVTSIEIRAEPGGRPFAALAAEAGPVGRFAPGQRLPVSVSISHAGAHALSAAAFEGDGAARRSLGIDLGVVEPRSPEFLATFLAEEERRWALEGAPADRDLRANLVWCAKEAVLKALGLGLTVDTWAVRCLPAAGEVDPAEWPLAPANGAWRPFVVTCDPALLPHRETVRGIWRPLDGGLVAALAASGMPL